MASTSTYSTRDLSGKPVFSDGGKARRMGKVERFIFHPNKNLCLGFVVKRPDLALMFHRPDMFIPLDSFEFEDGSVVVHNESKDAIGPGAIKRLGINWDMCVMWEGMPIIKESGEEMGTVGSVEFSRKTGRVLSLTVQRGAAAKALVGALVIPADLIEGFRVGIGAELAEEWTENEQGEEELLRGAILVSDDVNLSHTQGGLAEAAGQGAARAQDKARKAAQQVKPKVSNVAKKTGEAVNKGAFATGRQLGRTRGMFSAFKEEYDKASGKQGKSKK